MNLFIQIKSKKERITLFLHLGDIFHDMLAQVCGFEWILSTFQLFSSSLFDEIHLTFFSVLPLYLPRRIQSTR